MCFYILSKEEEKYKYGVIRQYKKFYMNGMITLRELERIAHESLVRARLAGVFENRSSL